MEIEATYKVFITPTEREALKRLAVGVAHKEDNAETELACYVNMLLSTAYNAGTRKEPIEAME